MHCIPFREYVSTGVSLQADYGSKHACDVAWFTRIIGYERMRVQR